MADKDKIVDEHFWFTATTLAVNAFLISTNTIQRYAISLKAISTVISLFAIFLIVHRSAAHADKIRMPRGLKRIPERSKTSIHKAKETWVFLKLFPKHLLFVICEFSGALFYLILVLGSCIAVWLML